jgi:hypothetical protein
MLYLFQVLVLIVLTQVVNRRFHWLISQLPVNASARTRIEYYAGMNNYLAIALFCELIGLGTITIDSITTDRLFFNKFLLDLFTKIFSIGFALSFPIALLILAPKAAPSLETPVSPVVMLGKPKRARKKSLPQRTSEVAVSPVSAQSSVGGNNSPTHLVRDAQGFFRVEF